MAHRLMTYDGLCSQLHGHNWTVEFTIEGEPSLDSGMIIDFGRIKQIAREALQSFDHSTILLHNDPVVEALRSADQTRVHKLNVPPTTENIAQLFFTLLSNAIHFNTLQRVSSVVVHETPNNTAIATEHNPLVYVTEPL